MTSNEPRIVFMLFLISWVGLLHLHDFRTGEQVAAEAVQVALETRALQVKGEIAGVGGAADVEEVAIRGDFGLQCFPALARGVGKPGIYPDHGRYFWGLLKQLMPDWEVLKARLERAEG